MLGTKRQSIAAVLSHLPPALSQTVETAVKDRGDELCEIRLRARKPVILIFTFGPRFITCAGRLTEFLSGGCLTAGENEVEAVFKSMCSFSVHSHTQSITQGFITLEGGSRVGVYGTAVTENGRIMSVRRICGLNIRISGDFVFASHGDFRRLYAGGCVNTLICGPPASGKTTALRDICRLVSDELGMKTAVIDERSEFTDCNVGVNTDVLTAYPKAGGIEIAVRTLSPDVIICDEAGSPEEVESICGGLNSGVRFIMTMHCGGRGELAKKPQFRALLSVGAVDCCAFIEHYRVQEIISAKELENESCSLDGSGCSVRADRAVCVLPSGNEGASA